MNANELRIGNFIFFDSQLKIGKHLEVATIENYGVRAFNGIVDEKGNRHLTALIPFSVVEPIPLTEELLLKFGFEISRSFNGIDAKINDFYLWKGDGWDYWDYSTVNDRWQKCNEVNVEIKHVHQLQNLYFALTGEELQLKPE